MSATKVLIVDDDEESRRLLSEVLGASGYAVRAVANRSAARELLAREDGYAIVVADLRMPDGTGIELLRDLKKVNSKQEMILMSSFMSASERQTALDLGARALLEKPFRLSELLEAVGELAAESTVRAGL